MRVVTLYIRRQIAAGTRAMVLGPIFKVGTLVETYRKDLNERAPVVLWLQGGPGDSSLQGLFNEMGPFSVAPDGKTLLENQHSWHRNHSLLFVDNPVGTGFSFTHHADGYARNQTQVGTALYECLTQFFRLFPELQLNDFFIAGSSYAGKYVPALGHFIHIRNPEAEIKINLKGVAVGNGYTDPINMVELHEFAYQLGFIDSRAKERMKSLEMETKQAALNGNMMEAVNKKRKIVELFHAWTDFSYSFNLLESEAPYDEYGFARFVSRPDVRAQLHVGATAFKTDADTARVYDSLLEENMVSVRPWLEELLEHYRVMYFSGQLDITVTYRMSVSMYERLQWSRAEEYRRSRRLPWYVDGVLAGYLKSAGGFTEVLVRNAGHVVARDQPVWALDLISRFITDTLPQSGS